MIEEVQDFVSDVKKSVGNKGFMFIVIGCLAFFVYNLLKDNDSESSYTANAYASYPDVDSNADVVIDTLGNEIRNSTNEITGSIESAQSEIMVNDDENTNDILNAINDSDYTNDYVNDGISSVTYIYDVVENNNTTAAVTSDNANIQTRHDRMLSHLGDGNAEVIGTGKSKPTELTGIGKPSSISNMTGIPVSSSTSKNSSSSSNNSLSGKKATSRSNRNVGVGKITDGTKKGVGKISDITKARKGSTKSTTSSKGFHDSSKPIRITKSRNTKSVSPRDKKRHKK